MVSEVKRALYEIDTLSLTTLNCSLLQFNLEFLLSI